MDLQIIPLFFFLTLVTGGLLKGIFSIVLQSIEPSLLLASVFIIIHILGRIELWNVWSLTSLTCGWSRLTIYSPGLAIVVNYWAWITLVNVASKYFSNLPPELNRTSSRLNERFSLSAFLTVRENIYPWRVSVFLNIGESGG